MVLGLIAIAGVLMSVFPGVSLLHLTEVRQEHRQQRAHYAARGGMKAAQVVLRRDDFDTDAPGDRWRGNPPALRGSLADSLSYRVKCFSGVEMLADGRDIPVPEDIASFLQRLYADPGVKCNINFCSKRQLENLLPGTAWGSRLWNHLTGDEDDEAGEKRKEVTDFDDLLIDLRKKSRNVSARVESQLRNRFQMRSPYVVVISTGMLRAGGNRVQYRIFAVVERSHEENKFVYWCESGAS